mgnify:CR=1 FL=1
MEIVLSLQYIEPNYMLVELTFLSDLFYILKSYELSEDLALAGLFHSIYGTDSFKTPLDIERDEIKKYIHLR